MISALRLQNFQSHKSTALELAPGVNAILGPSDSGKTAILRALLWVLTNRPTGEEFRSSWGGDTAVELLTDDKGAVTRERTKRANGYVWNKGSDNAVEFKALGAGVPEEIERALNIVAVSVQAQMDAPFLLSASPGEVARVLNETVGLELMDQAMAYIAGELRHAANNKEAAEREQERLTTELERFAGLDELAGAAEAAAQAEAGAGALRRQALSLSESAQTLELAERDEERYSATPALAEKVGALLAKEQGAQRAREEAQRLQSLADALSVAELAAERYGPTARLDIKPLEDLRTRYEGMVNNSLRLFHAADCVEIAEKKLGTLTAEVKQAAQLWEQERPDTCPLCGQEWA